MPACENFYKEADGLLQEFDSFVSSTKLEGVALPDHICFKCGSIESFEEIRCLLEKEAKFVHQANISGRRIAMIKLPKGFQTSLGEITVLELSDQKPNNSQTEGFDYIEIYPVNNAFEDFVREIETAKVPMNKIERPHHTTYDIPLGDSYNIKLTVEPIFEKIKRDEML